MNNQLVLIIIAVLGLCHAQRGCPMEGCDPRGLYSQADFQIADDRKPIKLWDTEVEGNYPTQSSGCIGNLQNVICRSANNKSSSHYTQSFASFTPDGKVKWVDEVTTDPEFPVMNSLGGIIAADSHVMEYRLANGSLVGKPHKFYGSLGKVSSLSWVVEESLFFFVSHGTGLLMLYDTSGMCVASHSVTEKDPHTNQTISVWTPVNKPIINNELDPITFYFIAQNNVTNKYRLIAMTINSTPGYLRLKWYHDIDNDVSSLQMAKVPMLAIRSYVLMGCGNGAGGLDEPPALTILIDKGDHGDVVQVLPIYATALSTWDIPVTSKHMNQSRHEILPIIWMAQTTPQMKSILLGYDINSHTMKYSFDTTKYLNLMFTMFSTPLMTFGYHAGNVTMVFGVTGMDAETNTRGYLLAVQPTSGDKMKVVWNYPLNVNNKTGAPVGQVIGVKENLLVVSMYQEDHVRVFGLRV